jgi:hypothetical protein
MLGVADGAVDGLFQIRHQAVVAARLELLQALAESDQGAVEDIAKIQAPTHLPDGAAGLALNRPAISLGKQPRSPIVAALKLAEEVWLLESPLIELLFGRLGNPAGEALRELMRGKSAFVIAAGCPAAPPVFEGLANLSEISADLWIINWQCCVGMSSFIKNLSQTILSMTKFSPASPIMISAPRSRFVLTIV